MDSTRCGCTGIRSCLLCREPSAEKFTYDHRSKIHWFCPTCTKVYQGSIINVIKNMTTIEGTWCKYHTDEMLANFTVNGIHTIEEFIDGEEEHYLIREIIKDPWKLSQSGRRKQDFGPKANFKRKKLKLGSFTGLPSYSKFLIERMKDLELLKSFQPVELCNLEYAPERGSSIDPHIDDMWLWGDQLVTINLKAGTILTLTKEDMKLQNSSTNQNAINTSAENIVAGSTYFKDKVGDNTEDALDLTSCLDTMTMDNVKLKDSRKLNDMNDLDLIEVQIPMPKRSLLVLEDEARTIWLHEIKASDLTNERLAMTFRNLSVEFEQEEKYGDIKDELVKIAQSFNGKIVV